RSLRPQEDLPHVLGKTDNGEDHIRTLRQRLGRFGPGRAGIHQRLRFLATAIVDRRLVPLGHDVPAHRLAHDAGADPAEARFAWFRLCYWHGCLSPESTLIHALGLLDED